MVREPKECEKAFLTSRLVQVTLPHSNPGSIPIWKRKNGNLVLSIRPGWDNEKDKPLGYPFGSIPRLLLFWITTEALRTKSRRLELGENLASFMRDIGLNPSTGGGKRGDSLRLKNQMERLFRSTISFEKTSENGKRWVDMQVAPEGELWWNFKNPKQTTLFESWIKLSDKFYEAIISTPVPLDKRALSALKRSPLALDLYAWATYKTFSLNKHNKEQQIISWRTFSTQLGSEYSDIANFKKKVKHAFKKVKAVYQELIMEEIQGGFIIRKGCTAISSLPSKKIKLNQALITNL